jgi:hypothetical protein
MSRNMGTADRAIRVLLAIVVVALYVTGTIAGTTAAILGLVAAVFVVTGLMGFCPAYVPFKFSTVTKK